MQDRQGQSSELSNLDPLLPHHQGDDCPTKTGVSSPALSNSKDQLPGAQGKARTEAQPRQQPALYLGGTSKIFRSRPIDKLRPSNAVSSQQLLPDLSSLIFPP